MHELVSEAVFKEHCKRDAQLCLSPCACLQVHELVSEAVFEEHCKRGAQLCLIAFLPDILDSKAAGRNAYIATMQKTAEAFKDRPYSYLWAAGGQHSELEASVDVGGFGYPALVALSPKKDVYAPLFPLAVVCV